jgi:transposase
VSIGDADVATLTTIAGSRTAPASRVERARILLSYGEDPSFFAVARALGLHHQTVQRCIERALAYGPIAALDDRPRPGKEPKITAEAKAWLVSLACRKVKDLGYPHELWTTRLLARHAREHGPAEGHACLDKLVQGTVCKILDAPAQPCQLSLDPLLTPQPIFGGHPSDESLKLLRNRMATGPHAPTWDRQVQ